MLAPNIIIPFDGLNANVPSGWSRDTRFDSRIPRHSNTGTGTTGGSDTHTHSINSHNHALNNHTHTVSFVDWTGGASTLVNAPSESNTISTHGHSAVTSSSMSAANSSSDSFTTGSGSSLPPYYSVIYIKSTGYNMVPVNGVLFTQTSLSNLTLCDGTAGTPNLTDKFLRGAAAGADAGTTGGTTNHTHVLNHSHASGASHTHSGTSGARTGTNVRRSYTNPAGFAYYNHAHTFTTNAATAPINAYTGTSAGDALIYPPFTTLKPYKNTGASPVLLQVGAIAMTTETTLPVGWVLCDGNNGTPNLGTNFVKCHTTALSTGGAATHTHPNVSHTHTSGTHSHSGTTNGPDNNSGQQPDGGSSATYIAGTTHTHTLSTDSITPTYANSDMVFAAGDSIPAYIEVKYIMATQTALGGGSASVIDAFL